MNKQIYCRRCKQYIIQSQFYSNNSLTNIAKGKFNAKDIYCTPCRAYLTKRSVALSNFNNLKPTPFEFWNGIFISETLNHFNNYYDNYSDFGQLIPDEPLGFGVCFHFYTIPRNQWNYYIKAFNYRYVFKSNYPGPFRDYLAGPDTLHESFLSVSTIETTLYKYKSIRHLVIPSIQCRTCKEIKLTFVEALNPFLYHQLINSGSLYPEITLSNFPRSYRTKTGYSHICNDCRFNPKKENKKCT